MAVSASAVEPAKATEVTSAWAGSPASAVGISCGMQVSSSGACGIMSANARSTAGASSRRWTSRPPVTTPSGCTSKTNSVTTPKFPPPPRSAQNSSGSFAWPGRTTAPAPERPEQLRLVRVASSHDRARRGDEFRFNEVVERHAVQAGDMADAARQCQTADTSVTIRAARHGQLEPLRTRIDVVPAGASLYRRGAGARINRDLPQQPEVDHQAAFADGMTGHAVTATPHRDR